MSDDLILTLKEIKGKFEEYYGRSPGTDDFVTAFAPNYGDEILVQMVYAMRKIGIPDDTIYAYYQSDGLLPCDQNIDLLSEVELKEYKALCEEYETRLNADNENGHINSLQFVVLSSSYIEECVDYTIEAVISSLNDFIHRHSENPSMFEYRMTSELDYCAFSALKTIRTLESIQKLKEDYLTECIYTLGRSVFENYAYLCSINHDPHLFPKKLLPRIDSENYSFATYPDGRINYAQVIHKNTGEQSSIRVHVGDLVSKLPSDIDRELYAIFYQTACQYVHVDIMSAKSYFSTPDPFDEINPALIAALIVCALSNLVLLEISEHKDVHPQFRQDIQFLCGENLKEKLINSLELANSDPEHQNAILDLLIRRMAE